MRNVRIGNTRSQTREKHLLSMNWYNSKEVVRMIGAKRYQTKQSQRLSKPKDIKELLLSYKNNLSRSMQNLDDTKLNMNRRNSVKSVEGSQRSYKHLENGNKLISNHKQNKPSKSFYGKLKDGHSSQKAIYNTYGEDDNVLYNTIDPRQQNNSGEGCLKNIDEGKRSRTNDLSMDKNNHKKCQPITKIMSCNSESGTPNTN